MTTDEILKRADYVLTKGNATLGNTTRSDFTTWVDAGTAAEFRAAGLTLIRSLYGIDHHHYADFDHSAAGNTIPTWQRAVSIIKVIREEIQAGWLQSTRALIAADLFADFLEMADYLLSEKYKDAAAVMVGSVLEEHLRFLCDNRGIAINARRGGKLEPNKADFLNAELAKAGAYNKLDQKQITAWLDLRNKAAHGHYGEYDQGQVQNMMDGVRNFLSRINN
jgi:hypothetical protein